MATWSGNEDPSFLIEKPNIDSGLLRFARRNYQPKKMSPDLPYQLLDIASGADDFDVVPDAEYDWATKAEQLGFRAERLRARAAAQRAKNAAIRGANSKLTLPNIELNLGGGGATGKRGPRFQRFVQAISGKESGGNYSAVNPDSGAMGKYQILPSNIEGQGRGWDYEALGRDISTQQFLGNPRLQEKIARAKLREYFDKYGPRGAASAWYSGDPNKWRDTSSQGAYPSIREYVEDIIRRARGNG